MTYAHFDDELNHTRSSAFRVKALRALESGSDSKRRQRHCPIVHARAGGWYARPRPGHRLSDSPRREAACQAECQTGCPSLRASRIRHALCGLRLCLQHTPRRYTKGRSHRQRSTEGYCGSCARRLRPGKYGRGCQCCARRGRAIGRRENPKCSCHRRHPSGRLSAQ